MNTAARHHPTGNLNGIKCLFILVYSITIPLFPTVLMADIYRSVDSDGVISFTDSPTCKNAKLVVKTAKKHIARGNPSRTTLQRQAALQKEGVIDKATRSHLDQVDNLSNTPEYGSPLADGVITSGVGIRIDPFNGLLRHHKGIDIAVPEGTRVNTVANGTVTFAGSRSGHGLTIIINHGDNLVTLYGHNSSLLVENGQDVKKGDQIAFSGNTGRSTGPHLHFEAWHNSSNVSASYIPIGMGSTNGLTAVVRQANRFRKDVLADGSILITNLPYTLIK